MSFTTAPFAALLIANRGEIAIRIARAASELGIRSVAVYAEDDAASLHVRQADSAVALNGGGVAAYLDMDQLIAIAQAQGCDAVHPGYGFLAENAEFARRCQAAGFCFVGPSSEVLQLFGDKAAARDLAERCEVPLVAGINRPISLAEAHRFFAEHGAVMLKAMAGGGGRGMRPVFAASELDEAFARCQSEARAAFGNDALYIEQLVSQARHIEIQVLGDASGAVSHLWERDCSLQRRQQKLVEIAPSPDLPAATRDRMIACALTLAGAAKYQGLGTFEFLLDAEQPERFYFMEANPRIQVEHTVTEQVTGVDLLHTQLKLDAGQTLADLGLLQPPQLNGCAVQLRINLESMSSDGSTRPAAGTLTAYQTPSGPGLRVDGYGYAGYPVSPSYDSLLAKLIAHAPDYPSALCEFRLEGVASNLHLLQNLLRLPQVASYQLTTRFVESQLRELLAAQTQAHPHHFFAGTQATSQSAEQIPDAPPGCLPLLTHSTGVVVSLEVAEGDAVAVGQSIAVLEAMKMEFVVTASHSGIVRQLAVQVGSALNEGQPLLFIEPAEVDAATSAARKP